MPTVAEVLAVALQNEQAGNFAQAELLYRQVLQADPSHAEAMHYLGNALAQQRNLDQAERCYRQALQLRPEGAETHHNLGIVLQHQGRLDEAVICYQQALRLNPNYADALNNLGFALQSQGRLEEATAAYHQALRLNPYFAEAHNSLGGVLHSQGRLEEAIASYQQAIRLNPNYAEAFSNLGNVLKSQGRLEEAMASYQQALRLNPNLAKVHYNLANALQSQGQLEEAVASYQQAIRLNPTLPEAQNNLGRTLQSQGRLEEAVACYRRAALLNPGLAVTHNNLGNALLSRGRLEEAMACHRRALELDPQCAETHISLARVLREQGQGLEASACYRRALQLLPNNVNVPVIAELVRQLQLICLWEDLKDLSQRVVEAVAKDAGGSAAAVDPFLFLALPTSTTAHQHRQCASQWVEQHLRLVRCPMSDVRSQHIAHRTSHIAPSRIKVGYLSADFHEHATAYLIAELIEKHDRQRFAVLGYSYGPDESSPMRRRLVKAFDRFVDLKDVSFGAAARRIQADEVDILVDLKGYTRLSRPQILALRPAPIQVNYLGYPGTMAAPFIDYILVDDFVVPPDQQPFFTEKLVHLPGCYQVNDSQREIAGPTPSRVECGLPQTGIVFCCFNSSYKITPEVFEVWMQLLKTVPGSVLWLLEDNTIAAANLRKEAETRGVAAERLVFAPPLPLAEHLTRHRLADLFLDTFPYNAHTTASDALWAGCLVLTMAGKTFPSRVAGSLLRTVGLPELITTGLLEYQEMALRLARDAECFNDLRARLQVNRATSGLFDGGRFARSLEQAYVRMWEIHTSGQEPQPFIVPHQPEAQAR